MSQHPEEITCQELVELVTDYLEGSMPPHARLRFEEHIAFCSPCVRYLEQMRETIAVTGTLREQDLDHDSRTMMLRVFREFTQ
jgi:anti-sigma factor RsiW